MNTDLQTFKKLIKQELPALVQSDKRIRQFIIKLSKEHADEKVGKLQSKMDIRFERFMDELKKDRERQDKKWEKNQRDLDKIYKRIEKSEELFRQEMKVFHEESERRLEQTNRQNEETKSLLREESNRQNEETKRLREDSNRLHEETKSLMREESNRQNEETKRLREESNRQNEETKSLREESIRLSEQTNKIWESVERLTKKSIDTDRRFDSTLGALGARWGIQSEATFRNALKGILADFNVDVQRVVEYDDQGVVFGHPEEIELDIVIINGKQMIAELKSSMSKSDVFIFYKKTDFYEKLRSRKADRLIIISPMVDNKAREFAEKLGMKIYSYAGDLPTDVTASSK